MKIFAGLELKGKKPRHAPTTTAVSMAEATSPFSSMTSSSEIEQMADTPQARPSRPSIKLMALVRPTIHTTVIGIAQTPKLTYRPKKLIYSTTTPCDTAMSATPICASSLIQALMEMQSSMTPTTTMMRPPSQMETSSGVISQNTSVATTKPAKIARPPMRGVGFLCMRRLSFGTSMAPIL